MKKAARSILLILAAVLGTGALTLVGSYFAIPALFPDIAPPNKTESSKTTATPDTTNQMVSDSLEVNVDTTAGPDQGEVIARLRDSVALLQEQAETMSDRIETLEGQKDSIASVASDLQAEKMEVQRLSGALTEMRRRNLQDLLKEVDMDVLRRLYKETSGRAQTRLLRSMPPAMAGRFVNDVVRGKSAATSTPGGSGPEDPQADTTRADSTTDTATEPTGR